MQSITKQCILWQLSTIVVAVFVVGLANEVAHAQTAYRGCLRPGWTNRPAHTAVAWVVTGVGADGTTLGRTTDAVECTITCRADFIVSAHIATGTAVGWIDLQIDTGVAAFVGAAATIKRTLAVQTDLACAADFTAHAAVGRVGGGVDAYATA